MGKVDEYTSGRMQGLLRARDLVKAWMPLPEPYREVTDEENLESRR